MLTKILILKKGEPLIGAEVIVGDIVGQLKETDEGGRIAFDLEPGYAAYVQVLITEPSGLTAVGFVRLIAGEEPTIKIP